MKQGGGKAKGSEFERQVGKLLSLWLTNGEKPDLFSRNVLSGGAFTQAQNRGKASSRMPGDLMAAHPLAFSFMSQFSVECKHLADIGLDSYMWDPKAGTMLGQIIALAKQQAHDCKLEYMVIAKQNKREPLVFVNGLLGHKFLAARRVGKRMMLLPMYHKLHKDSVFVMRLVDMCVTLDPDKLLEKTS